MPIVSAHFRSLWTVTTRSIVTQCGVVGRTARTMMKWSRRRQLDATSSSSSSSISDKRSLSSSSASSTSTDIGRRSAAFSHAVSNNNSNNNNNSHDNVYGAVIMTRVIARVHPVHLIAFYRPTKGVRLSRPKHCSEGAQPVL